MKILDQFKEYNIKYAVGNSLGEYTALCAAGVITFE